MLWEIARRHLGRQARIAGEGLWQETASQRRHHAVASAVKQNTVISIPFPAPNSSGSKLCCTAFGQGNSVTAKQLATENGHSEMQVTCQVGVGGAPDCYNL